MRKAAATALLAVLVLALLSGCGGSDDGGSGQGPGEATSPSMSSATEPGSGSADHDAPQGAEDLSPKATAYYAKRLAENFPEPKPGKAKGSKQALQAGRDDCKGKTPTQIAEQYGPDAQLDPDQEELLEELPRYEAEAARDPNFIAGQVAAMVYEATLAQRTADAGFQGCVYVLARELGEGLQGR